MKRLGILISGGGTDLQSIIDNIKNGYIPAEIGVVISNKKDAYGLVRAKDNGIPAVYLCKKHYKNNEEFNLAILDQLQQYNIDYVVLAGYLNILSSDVIRAYPNKIINIHPSLIPSFCGKGFYGEKVHQAVLDYGVKVTGATVHFVDEGTDTGPIILQQPVMIKEDDDPESLSSRVLEVEHRILPDAVKLLVEDRLKIHGRRVIIR
ncbi:MAG: phosphoribosylglycinamide formyltransferase [Xylanivirga thermophila]|jgi:phosphoribosylglycinamide formyltransferase 1|uniref:phosphoribosylglycinamide formyltransferase n=1 Tax=Xylanivirga thermophila TaxID=2496273 RepID=UPI00101C5F11|nr:phosphoribosylglycinamide formyltransferase [Xylanivirga thermophila]